MKKIQYSPDALEKIQKIESYIATRFGRTKAKEVKRMITKRIRDIAVNDNIGESVEALFGIPTDFRFFFVKPNYIFYRVTATEIRIINIYNEREDFMLQLFGIGSIDETGEDYWNNIDNSF